ncbi:heme-binding protein [Streptococcus uberis]|uniref:heme-binding protein n=1 Tax=Streptococcus uberis TaxID=1349 RepID=UPI000E1BE313|nr:heme-binding protein [Streptococcus uberis]
MSHDLMALAQQFSEEDKEILASIEESLIFQSFDSQAALALGVLLVEEAVAFGEEPAIRIKRLSDGAAIFQYIGNSGGERNIGFALRKMVAVRATGFSSLYSLALLGDNPQLLDLERTLPVAGALPIKVAGEMVAILGISGLHHGNDHRLLMQVLSNFLGVKLPEYKGLII